MTRGQRFCGGSNFGFQRWMMLASLLAAISTIVVVGAGSCGEPATDDSDVELGGELVVQQMLTEGAEGDGLSVDWRLAYFADKRHVTKIELIMYKPSGFDISRKALFSIDTTDELVRVRAERGLSDLMRPLAWEYQQSAGSGMSYGELRITATDGAFSVYLYGTGFAMVHDFDDPKCGFYSWTLAKVVDDLYYRKTGEHLSQDRLDGLVGEFYRRAEVANYDREEKELKSAVDDKDGKGSQKREDH
jgi:hypothetical protein